MTGKEIREKIIFNNQEIDKQLDPSVFVLQPEVAKLIEENEELKSQCPHEFVDGECVYCGTKE